jgi:hypothetical protein
MSGNKDAGLPGIFCALAWLHRFTNAQGQIQVCCSSEEWDNNIRDADGAPMNIVHGRADEEILNSGFMKDVRRQMLAGRWPSFCQRCLVTEKTGGSSRRNQENDHFRAEIPALLAETEEDGTISARVRSADYRLGNICNLACRMCNPSSSAIWIRTWAPKDGGRTAALEAAAGIRYDWYRDPAVMEKLKKQAATLRHLHFAGGEPLIVPEMIDLLRHCVDAGFSSAIELTYNTNITKIPQALKDLWPRFRAVRLFCSVDAFGELNELIRHPSSWKTIDRNLRDLDRNFDAYGLKEVLVMTTVQVYNVFRLRELYDYLFENMTRVSQLPNLVDLHYPAYYSTQILPPDLKKSALRGLSTLLDATNERIGKGLIRPDCAGAVETLKSSIRFLELADHPEEIPKFARQVEGMDAISGRSFYRLVPELAVLKDARA